jgi:hypothetical protein
MNAVNPNCCASEQSEPREAHYHFIEGWFTQMFNSGRNPSYGYPANHLPDPKVDGMDVQTTFFTRSKA